MKKKLPIFFIMALFVVGGAILNQNRALSNRNGSPTGRTGAPGENTCANSCHTGSAVNSGTATTTLTTNIPVSGFVGKETYTVTISIAQSGISRWGFQVTAVNGSGTKIGSWNITNSTETQIVGTNWVTHKSAGTNGTNSKTWTVDWIAPCAGEDTVIFYASYNAANSNNFSSGDLIYTRSIGYPENVINSADTVSNLSAIDIADNYDGRDLRVSFKTSECESRTLEYRAFAVKVSNAPSFTKSLAAINTNYAVVNTGTPNTTKTVNFGSAGKDTDGDNIRNHEPYKIFLFSAADNSLVTNDTMIEFIDTVILTSPKAFVSNIVGSDTGKTGNASDLLIQFDTPSKEGTIGDYQTMMVKSSSASSFTITDAKALNPGQFVLSSIGNPSSTIDVTLGAGFMDGDGDTLEPYVDYRIFVLSKADSINSLVDTLQQSAADISFDTVAPPPVTGIIDINSAKISFVQLNSQLIVDIQEVNSMNSTFEIYSLSGQKQHEGIMYTYPYTIDLSGLANGMSILRITIGKEMIVHKFVK